MFTLLHSLMSFLTLVRHSCTARSKSSETSRLSRPVCGGLEGSSVVWFEEVANGKTTVALLNFLTEKRDQILLIVSCGGTCFFFFFGFADGGGGFCGWASSESLESDDILASWVAVEREKTVYRGQAAKKFTGKGVFENSRLGVAVPLYCQTPPPPQPCDSPVILPRSGFQLSRQHSGEPPVDCLSDRVASTELGIRSEANSSADLHDV